MALSEKQEFLRFEFFHREHPPYIRKYEFTKVQCKFSSLNASSTLPVLQAYDILAIRSNYSAKDTSMRYFNVVYIISQYSEFSSYASRVTWIRRHAVGSPTYVVTHTLPTRMYELNKVFVFQFFFAQRNAYDPGQLRLPFKIN